MPSVKVLRVFRACPAWLRARVVNDCYAGEASKTHNKTTTTTTTKSSALLDVSPHSPTSRSHEPYDSRDSDNKRTFYQPRSQGSLLPGRREPWERGWPFTCNLWWLIKTDWHVRRGLDRSQNKLKNVKESWLLPIEYFFVFCRNLFLPGRVSSYAGEFMFAICRKSRGWTVNIVVFGVAGDFWRRLLLRIEY